MEGLGYIVYKHIDESKRQSCPTSKIMKKYVNNDIMSKLSTGEIIDYKRLIEEASNKQKMYSSIYKKLNVDYKKENISISSNDDIKFNYKAKIKTQVNHISKIPITFA